MQNIDASALAAAKSKLDAAEAQREEVLLRHIANGVDIRSRNVEIGSEVVIAPGAVILAGTILRGKTTIGAGCVIGPNTLIEDSTVDEGTTVNASQVYSSHLGPHNNIGPFTHVRINTVTGYGVHLGAYVETKNSNFARGNTVSHLTYIGDSDVGKYCNFGCGTVTCNYDGMSLRVSCRFVKNFEKSMLSPCTFALRYDTIEAPKDLLIRPRKQGDEIRLPGGRKTLKKLFIDRKIPASQRALVPVVTDGVQVLLVYPFAVSSEHGAQPGEAALLIQFMHEKEYIQKEDTQ